MVDLKILRRNPEIFIEIINKGRGNKEKADIKKWLKLDSKKNKIQKEIESLKAQKNQFSLIGKTDINKAREGSKKLKTKILELEKELAPIEKEWQEILDWIPNLRLSQEAMPDGKSEEDNPIIKAWTPETGYIKNKNLGKAIHKVSYMPNRSIHWDKKLVKPKHHIEIGKALGIIDNEQSAITSGSRFTYIRGKGAVLQYAIQQLFFSELIKRGFVYQIPPLLVKSKVLYGTSHFPEGLDQAYKIESNNVEDQNELYLVGSSEPSNFAYFMGKVLEEKDLPIKIFAYTPCFRSEVGSWGKDVKGIKRVHQFDKIEMNAVCTENQSKAIFEDFLDLNEWFLQTLKIPYRLARKCTADGGYLASAEQIDPEAWLPAQSEFMEVGTDTNTTDFQARRLNIKYRAESGEKKYVHTVNDTGVAMGRIIIAILDNYQQSDGSVIVPEILHKYTGFEVID